MTSIAKYSLDVDQASSILCALRIAEEWYADKAAEARSNGYDPSLWDQRVAEMRNARAGMEMPTDVVFKEQASCPAQ